MSRELKRVALDFVWPLGKTWDGYVNPYHSETCPHCEGSGYSPEAKIMHDLWYGYVPFNPEDKGSKPFTSDTPEVRAFAQRNLEHSPKFYGVGELAMFIEATRLADHFNRYWMHHLSQDDVDALFDAGELSDFKERPTAEQVNRYYIGRYDDPRQGVVMEAECKRRGVLAYCVHCDSGEIWPSQELKKAHDEWVKVEPPEGEAYQVWQTVTEGGPISPPFTEPEPLAEWLASHSYGADDGITQEQWLKFILGPGWAPTAVKIGDGPVMSGVQGIE